MERFVNKVAVVTGSSSGIGKAISEELVKNGIIVVGLARREDRLQELNNELQRFNYSGKFYPLKCDITNVTNVVSSFRWIESKIGAIHILVNNAAVLNPTNILNVTAEQISQVFDTNVKGVILCSKEAASSMINNSIKGHVININSIAGHYILSGESDLGLLYSSSKHALTVVSEGLRRELLHKNTDIKVTNISPGMVESEMSDEMIRIRGQDKSTLSPELILKAKDIANACVSVLNTPPNVLISEFTIIPIRQKI